MWGLRILVALCLLVWVASGFRAASPRLAIRAREPLFFAEQTADGPEEAIPSKFITANDKDGAPQGYLSSDLKSMGEGKQSRVLAYIALALVPCLFLVPFFLSRDFQPPTIE